KKNGYDLIAFSKEFERWGFISIIPLERFRKLRALKGAVMLAGTIPKAKKNDIHIAGLSEGAFLSLLSVENSRSVKTLTMIAPQSIHYTGKFSFPEIIRQIDKFKIPVLLIVGKNEKKWRLKVTDLIRRIFIQKKKKLSYVEYDCDKRWFWNSQNIYMNDIYRFITGKDILKIPYKYKHTEIY
ncbi:MAG: hypothetical protein GY730_08635, partial [bacterium]|nr:hypothetical protein [bacterium]